MGNAAPQLRIVAAEQYRLTVYHVLELLECIGGVGTCTLCVPTSFLVSAVRRCPHKET